VRFCLLNPWPNGALAQASVTIQLVAAELGHEAIRCHTTRDVLDARPDFVLVMQHDTPKLTPFPTYGLIHEPVSEYLQDAVFLMNLLSYDGYFSLADIHRDFIRSLLTAAGRKFTLGSYYCHTATELPCDWSPDFSDARAAYVGLNWDRRNDALFRELDTLGCLEVYGPEAEWLFLSRGEGGTYRRPLPFDHVSVRDAYRRAGIGLCLCGDNWLGDDILTGRVFEATAAGAVAITPRVPWIERSFGDTVLYLDQGDSFAGIAAAVDRHVRWVRANPGQARGLVEKAQSIYRSHFDQRVLLENVFTYHRRELARRAARPPRSDTTTSVVLRVTGRGHADLRRALDSLAAQDAGRLELVLDVPKEIDVPADLPPGRERFEKVTILHGADEGSLMAALKLCSGAQVAVMSDEDEWLPDHVTSLLDTMKAADTAAAYAETIVHVSTPFRAAGADGEVRRAWFACTDDGPLTPEGALRRLPLGAIMFRAELLREYFDGVPIGSAEHARLLLTVLSRTRLASSGRLTSIQHLEPGAALPRLAGHDLRPGDELALRLLFRTTAFPAPPPALDWQILRGLDVSRSHSIRRSPGHKHYLLPPSVRASLLPEPAWRRVETAFTPDNVKLAGESTYNGSAVFPAHVRLPDGGWAYGLVASLALVGDRRYVLRLHCRIESGPVSFGVLYRDGERFAHRLHLPSQPDRLSVDLPILFPDEASSVVVSAGGGVDPVSVVVFGAELYEVDPRPEPLEPAPGVRYHP
jgi:hypothetical protein